jgi:cytochrome P450
MSVADLPEARQERLTPPPSHVDPRLVVDFDCLAPPGFAEHGDLFKAWKTLHDGPDIVWTPRHGGHWILTRAEDIGWAQADYGVLSHREITVPPDHISLPPITLDPPDNLPYRAVLTPSFTRKQVQEVYAPKIRALTAELIESLKPRGRCEFVADFAQVMPVNIFLGIADLPTDRRREFLAWGRGMGVPETRDEYAAKIAGYLGQALDARPHGDDLLGRIAAFRDGPVCPHAAEAVNMAMVVFSGGLDTVAAALSFAMRHLAERPDQQQRLRRDPSLIPKAVEELLRRFGLTSLAHVVIRECERKGARFMPGDMVMVPPILAGMDETFYERPMEVDFDRDFAVHYTFGNGPHKCLGQYLARAEFEIFLEEWLGRMPDVQLDPERPPWGEVAPVLKLAHLDLIWDAQV